MEADMSSVKHNLYYSEEIEEETPAEIPETDPKEGEWPTKGEIETSNSSMKYCEGPLVLSRRINTSMDSNHVFVLDVRNIAEFDSPDALMS
eukprot:9298324-Ditylum_brightwellii.AAC.1